MHIAANRHEPRQNHQLQWQAVLSRDESIERDSVQPSGILGTRVLQIYGWFMLDIVGYHAITKTAFQALSQRLWGGCGFVGS